MKKVKVLLIIVLMGVGVYFMADQSGLVTYFNDMVNERDGWVQTGPVTYSRQKYVEENYIAYSILNDPQFKGEFQMFRGPLKKHVLDRMDHKLDHVYRYKTDEKTPEGIEEDLKYICRHMYGNTVILNMEGVSLSVESESFSLFNPSGIINSKEKEG